MKVPRWLMILMLASSVLGVLFIVGWWWVTWPERTAREFLALIALDRRDEAKSMAQSGSSEPFYAMAINLREADWSQRSLRGEPRTWSDIVYARQGFRIHSLRAGFSVDRGKVILSGILVFFDEQEAGSEPVRVRVPIEIVRGNIISARWAGVPDF